METESFNVTISEFDGRLQYAQSIDYKDNNEVILTWSFLINQSIFQPKEINDYINFIDKLSSAAAKIAVIKKK